MLLLLTSARGSTPLAIVEVCQRLVEQAGVTYDAAQLGAIVLKRRFEDDPQWSQYIGRLGEVKSRIHQTVDAFLVSPLNSLRPKPA